MRISFLSIILFLLIGSCLHGQEDDFFLQGEDKDATESSIFEKPGADLDGYYDDVVQRTLIEDSPFYPKSQSVSLMWCGRKEYGE